jgi:hypothetical protein
MLTLILSLLQGACRCSLSHERQEIFDKWVSATNQTLNWPRCDVKNQQCYIDNHSQIEAVTVLLSLSAINTASTLVVHNSNQSTI